MFMNYYRSHANKLITQANDSLEGMVVFDKSQMWIKTAMKGNFIRISKRQIMMYEERVWKRTRKHRKIFHT